MTEKKRHRKIKPHFLVRGAVWILVVGIILLVLGTLMIALFTSLKTPEETMASSFRILPEEWRWENYLDVIKGDIWGRYFFNSTLITAVVVSGSILISALAGYAFARMEFKGRQPLFLLFLCGMMIPGQVYIIPQYILMRSIPLVGGNDLYGKGGMGFLNTYWGLIIPFLAAPLGVFLIKQFYMGFPKSLDEAARLDGCSSFQIFRYIYLPLSKPVFATFAILKFTGTWNDYFYSLIMTNSKTMYTVQIALQQYKGEYGIQWHYLMAATILSVLPILVVYIFAQKYFTQGIVTSGLK